MLTLKEFIEIAEKNKQTEKDRCKKWLYKQIRMQLNKDSVKIKKNWKINLVHTEVSLINPGGNDFEGNIDCNHKIIKAINDIKNCTGTLTREISKIEPYCQIDIQELFKELKKRLDFNSRGIMAPSLREDKFKKNWKEYLKENNLSENLDLFNQEFEYPKIENLDIEKLSIKLKEESNSHELFDKLTQDKSSMEEIRKLLTSYQFKDEDLPSKNDIYSICLGKYSPREEKITIYLNTIYDSAKIKGIDPVILLRKVLIHEMAHCLHHIGIDGDDKIWNDFGYSIYGKDTIEGLAQWYTYRYMYYYDEKLKNNVPINLLTMLWFTNYQSSPYKHFMKWREYNFENMNRVLVEARVNEKLKEPTGKEFDETLMDNFNKKTV